MKVTGGHCLASCMHATRTEDAALAVTHANDCRQRRSALSAAIEKPKWLHAPAKRTAMAANHCWPTNVPSRWPLKSHKISINSKGFRKPFPPERANIGRPHRQCSRLCFYFRFHSPMIHCGSRREVSWIVQKRPGTMIQRSEGSPASRWPSWYIRKYLACRSFAKPPMAATEVKIRKADVASPPLSVA